MTLFCSPRKKKKHKSAYGTVALRSREGTRTLVSIVKKKKNEERERQRRARSYNLVPVTSQAQYHMTADFIPLSKVSLSFFFPLN